MRLDDKLANLAGTQHSVVATWQAAGLGANRTEVGRLRRSKRWERETDRVLRAAGAAVTYETEASVAVLDAGPGAALSHQSDAFWWGVPGFTLHPMQVSQPERRANYRSTRARLHDLRAPLDEWTTVLNGVRVVRPELLIYQLCGCIHPLRAERALDAAWSLRLVSGQSLRDVLTALRKQGRNGTSVLEQLLEQRGEDYVPPATGLESRFQEIARTAGVTTLLRQIDSGGDHWCGRVDFRDEKLPLLVEVQSERYHRALSYGRDDEKRIADLLEAGFVVFEVWDSAVWHRGREVVATLREARRAACSPVLPAQRRHFCVH